MPSIETAHEAELALERLFDKHAAWLVQQPEWRIVLALPRKTRKRIAQDLAVSITTIPTNPEPGFGRDVVRRIVRQIERDDRAWYKGLT